MRLFAFVVCALLVVGCSRAAGGGALPAASMAGAVSQAAPDSANLVTLYSFTGKASGGEPHDALVNVKGTLYGTTSAYGAGYGTVFAISPLGKFRTIHEFTGRPDGANPLAGLVELGGRLYGTTSGGGVHGGGTIYTITPAGRERVLYSFGRHGDGTDPESRVIVENGILYGTTRQGGKRARGTVFAVNQAGDESVLHSFAGGPGDGAHPGGGLVRVNDWFYGVTLAGGQSVSGGSVYRINALGQEKVLHSFAVTNGDGKGPNGTLLPYDGVLFGTTRNGGNHARGTIYEITTQGNELVIHSFGSKLDGAFPVDGLTLDNGQLFGTTTGGGFSTRRANECISSGDVRNDGYYRCGTVFRVDQFGTEHVVYRFRGDPNGANPESGLRNVAGILYGTTFWGGSSEYYGTVFRLVP